MISARYNTWQIMHERLKIADSNSYKIFLVNDKMYSWRESFESPKIVMISEANRNLDHSEKQLQMYLFYEKATRDSVP